MKRKHTSSSKVDTPFKRPRSVVPKPMVMSSSKQQAIRVGGWSNPSRMSRGELKFVDTFQTFTPTVGSNAFAITAAPINGVAQGTSASDRIGRKTVAKSILIRYNGQLAPTSTQGGLFRILVVYDKQANATAPAINDVLLSDNFVSFNNLSNRDRFVTLFDELTDPISTGGPLSCAGRLYKKISLETLYNTGTTGGIGSIQTGSIYVFVAQNAGILTAAASLVVWTRIRYDDV